MSERFICGHKDEWEYFEKSYAKHIPVLIKCHDVTLDFAMKAVTENAQQHVILLLAKTCIKEFEEILVLCGNGYGSGSMKLLRTLYERIITLTYLATHTEEIQQYIDYSDVHNHKLLMEARAVHVGGGDLTPEQEEDVIAKYAAVRDKFLQEDCKKCKTKRLQGSWTKKSMPELAKNADTILRQFYFRAYLRPTLYSHATFIGTMWQIDTSDEGIRLFGDKVEHENVEEALSKAHFLLVQASNVTNDFFNLGQGGLVKELFNDWADIWKSEPPPAPPKA
jgi:hypothetical protein